MSNEHVLRSRLAYHLRCLEEDATDPELSQLERLALVRDRARRIREVQVELEERVRMQQACSRGR